MPYLPKSVVKLLECMCSPESTEKDGREFQNGDRVTQGLSTVWSLILRRPSNRDICLKIALQVVILLLHFCLSFMYHMKSAFCFFDVIKNGYCLPCPLTYLRIDYCLISV